MAYGQEMSEASEPNRSPSSWIESLERSKAQIVAGHTEPLLPLLDRLRSSAERMEALMGIPPDEVEPTNLR
jgi:hypothetical protein